MQGLWYGDKRDRVKWGALVHLANTKGIRCIIQVAYFRHGTDLKLQTEEGEVPLPIEVWNHFSNLRHIERLGKATGLNIIVLDQYLEANKHPNYIHTIVSHLDEINKEIKGRKIIFLDPDTGIEPEESSGPEHVTKKDLELIWKNGLSQGDVLVVYQHADHTKKWLFERSKKMFSICEETPVKIILGKDIAADVAMLWCLKDRRTEPHIKSSISERIPSKIKKLPRPCSCQCGGMTKGGYFCPGHDAKLKSIFLKVGKGEKTKKQLDKMTLKMYQIWEKDNSRRLIDIAREVLG